MLTSVLICLTIFIKLRTQWSILIWIAVFAKAFRYLLSLSSVCLVLLCYSILVQINWIPITYWILVYYFGGILWVYWLCLWIIKATSKLLLNLSHQDNRVKTWLLKRMRADEIASLNDWFFVTVRVRFLIRHLIRNFWSFFNCDRLLALSSASSAFICKLI